MCLIVWLLDWYIVGHFTWLWLAWKAFSSTMQKGIPLSTAYTETISGADTWVQKCICCCCSGFCNTSDKCVRQYSTTWIDNSSSKCSLRVVSDIFRTRVLHYQASQSAPVCQSGSLTLAHIACQDVFLVAVVKNNANVVMALKWLDLVCTLTWGSCAAMLWSGNLL